MEEKRVFRTFRGYQILKQNKKLLTPSMEDYLEMIYKNCVQEGYVRINQLAEQLNVQASSVTKIVQKLGKLEFIKYEKYGIIQLTDKGRETGAFLLERHVIIEKFLSKIGIEETLLRDTEMIEHNISLDSLHAIESLYNFFNDNLEILEKFNDYRKERDK